MESSSSSDLSSSAMKQRSIVKSPWQTCLDAKGRVFYVNHETEETSWINPEKNLPRQQRRKRRDSISQVHRGEFVSVTPRRTIAHNDSMIENSDAISEFLQRDDFIIKLHDNEKAMSLYNSSAIVRHALHRIQHRVDSPHRYQSSGEFVEFVNAFADRTEPLPLGWEMKSIDGKRVFLSHSHRVTTLFDPRVRLLESRQRRGRSAPPKRGSAIDSVDKNGNHVLVNKYDEIMHVAQEKLPHIAGRIRKKLRLIDRFGELAIASLANDLDLSLAVSMLDDNEEKNDAGEPTSDQRITEFYAQLYRAKYSRGPLKITWNISRENLVQDAHSHILEADINLLKRARIHIVFDDEIGLDYGGPSREFFLLLSRQLFNPSNGYFDYHGNDYQLQLCRRHQIRTEDIRWLRLCARILALSIIHKCLIDVFFTQVFYKHLLKMKIHIDDFEQCDPQFYNSMKWILENDVSELDMKFIYTDVEITGKTCDFNLLPSGDSITVTNENKHDFVNLMCQAQSKKGIEEQLTIITTEFHQILSLDLIGQLSPSELSMTLSGSMELDLFDWRSNTIYKGGYFDSHVVIEWFWDCVEQMTNEQRFNLLLFATGTSTVPFDGFASLRGTNGSNRFCIEKWGEETSLPRAHTCFNRLQLPSYQTKKIMKDKIMQAITNGLSYSIE